MKLIVFKCFFELDFIPYPEYDFSSAFRGLWGRSLKNMFCLQKNINCQDCSFNNCLYYNIFEKTYESGEEYKPYIIFHNILNQSQVEIHFSFFGIYAENADRLFASIMQLAERKLKISGKETEIKITKILDYNDHFIFEAKNKVFNPFSFFTIDFKNECLHLLTIDFITPLRMKYQNRLMTIFNSEAFLKSMIRRIRFMNSEFNLNLKQDPIYKEEWKDIEFKANL